MKKGFTLSELLLSLIIVGVVAVLTIPVLMNNVQHKTFATQVKNLSAMIEQIAQDELIAHRTRDLNDTDFGNPGKLLSDDHFSIAKTCSASKSLKDCWKTTTTGKDKVIYKFLDKSTANITVAARTIILKNGVMIRYSATTSVGNAVGQFLIDVNGNDKPNIGGRDLFGFYITNKGHVVDVAYAKNETKTLAEKISLCNSNVWYCYGALVDSGWKMDY